MGYPETSREASRKVYTSPAEDFDGIKARDRSDETKAWDRPDEAKAWDHDETTREVIGSPPSTTSDIVEKQEQEMTEKVRCGKVRGAILF